MSNPDGPADLPEQTRPEPSASGLREDQIHPDDLAEYARLFSPATVKLEAVAQVTQLEVSRTCGAGELQVKPMVTDMALPPTRRIRVVPLPGKAAIKKQKLPKTNCKIAKGLEVALRASIMRERCSQHELSLDQAETLRQALVERFGQAAPGMLIEAIYPHVPPEAAKRVRVEPSLERIRFQWPVGLKVTKARAGFYLVVLRDPDGKRLQLLLRL